MNQAPQTPITQRLRAAHVWLDACTYRNLGFDWDGRTLAGLAELADRGLIAVVMTEITRQELSERLKEAATQASVSVSKAAVAMRQAGLTEAASSMENKQSLLLVMEAAANRWLTRCHVQTLSIAFINLKKLLDDYFAGRPPFGKSNKKAEFPDAITMQALQAWSDHSGTPCYVVSSDQGVLEACQGSLFPTSSPREILSHAVASVAIHDAIVQAVKANDWLAEHLDGDLTSVIEIRNGMRHGGVITAEIESATVHEQEVQDILIDEIKDDTVRCTLWIWAVVKARVLVTQDPSQMGPDEWDSGWRHSQDVYPTIHTTATLHASVQNDCVTLQNAYFDDSRIVLDFDDIARDLD